MRPEDTFPEPSGVDQDNDLGQTIDMTSRTAAKSSPATSSTTSGSGGGVGERLFSIALTRIREKGFEGVTVSEITREASVAKGTFFNYFRTKDHILSEYLRRTLREALESVEDRGHSGTGAILALCDSLLDRLLADPLVANALISRLGSLPPSQTGEPSEMTNLQSWIGSRLAETLPIRVPLVDPPHPTSLPSHLTWALRGKLEEWSSGRIQGGKVLRKAVHREMGFLLSSAGLPSE